jgi:argonaute-like protein implicated in RNA metabolism and viral defense
MQPRKQNHGGWWEFKKVLAILKVMKMENREKWKTQRRYLTVASQKENITSDIPPIISKPPEESVLH